MFFSLCIVTLLCVVFFLSVSVCEREGEISLFVLISMIDSDHIFGYVTSNCDVYSLAHSNQAVILRVLVFMIDELFILYS